MNKYFSFIAIVAILCSSGVGVAQTTVSLRSRIAQAALIKQAEVTLVFDWQREIRLRDVMSRPPRGSARHHNVTLKTEYKTTRCKGALTQTGYVVTPALCTREADWHLSRVTLLFADGRKGTGTEKTFSVRGEVAYVRVSADLTQGLHGLVLATTPYGKSLEEHFGGGVMEALASLFRSKGVTHSKRWFRPGKTYPESSLKVGDAVVYNGKLVALVKETISHYRYLSDRPLAVIRT